MTQYVVQESQLSHFFLSDTASAPMWLVFRAYVGWLWLDAALQKLNDPAWVGSSAGSALRNTVQLALGKTDGVSPDVQGWYASFLQNTILPHAVFWSQFVAWSELVVGIALMLGFLTGIMAFISLFLSFNYLLAGSLGMNPVLLLFSIGLIMAWRISGYWGLDHFVLPLLRHFFRPKVRLRVIEEYVMDYET